MDEDKPLMQRIVSWPARVKNYVQELQLEMRRVTWPTWKQVRATTGVVIVAVFMFAAFFWVVDGILSRGMNRLIHTFSK